MAIHTDTVEILSRPPDAVSGAFASFIDRAWGPNAVTVRFISVSLALSLASLYVQHLILDLKYRGASYLLRADVSQFYPSLYTHAVGWAVDPALRLRANWTKPTFLGKRLDQALMDMQGKISQGVPIGNDISFLLAEIVLGQVDRDLRKYKGRAYRWFDDWKRFEI